MAEPAVSQADYPEFLQELSAKIAALLVDRGIDSSLAMEVARDCAEYVRADWGGERIYIPMGRAFDLAQRDREIEAKFTGRNTHEVCLEFGISETHLRRIVTAVRRERARTRHCACEAR